MTRTIASFETIVLADFEFVAKPGERPDVVCLAWRELGSEQTHRLWRNELGPVPPYRTDDKVLFVCFVANAELGCHLALGWPLPAHVLDLNPVFRNAVNGRTVPDGRGLVGMLRHYGIRTGDSQRKAELQQRIAQGWPFSDEEIARILLYCASDVDALAQLLPKVLPDLDLGVALYHGEFVRASALMEHFGVPIDRPTFLQLTDKAAWRAVRDAMVPAIDAQYGVYRKDKAGDWIFSMELFQQYLDRQGIVWPLTEKGKLSTRRKVFENQSKGHPQLEALRQLRHTRDKMRRIKLAVGDDGRNRTVLWPFQSKTGRTQPKASQWIFSPAVWLRCLIRPEPGQALAYVDWSSMEFMIAAALSNDPIMLEFYRSGDPYLSFARRVNAAPPDATKRTHGPLRDAYKVGLLAAQYGIQADSLAGRLGCSTFAAHEMLQQHRELFRVYWRWADDWLAHSLDSGRMWTAFGWQCAVGITEFNDRSIQNFVVQAHGAEILRIAVILATRRGLGLRAPVHDALLLESPLERIESDVALLQELMRRASRIVLNPAPGGPHELRTDATIIRYPERYSDPRGDAIWVQVTALLADYQENRNAPEDCPAQARNLDR